MKIVFVLLFISFLATSNEFPRVTEVLISSIEYLRNNTPADLDRKKADALIFHLDKMLVNHQKYPAKASKDFKERWKIEKTTIAFVDLYAPPVYVTPRFEKLDNKFQLAIYLHELAHTIGFDECGADTLSYYATRFSDKSDGIVLLSYYSMCQFGNPSIYKRVDQNTFDKIIVNGEFLDFAKVKNWVKK